MKRFLAFMLSTVLILCINTVQVHPISIEDGEINITYAEEDPSTPTNSSRLYLTNNYATHYFSNLHTNFPKNDKGSCGYVAMAMLLSFFDTYWDDTIIPENLDATVQVNPQTSMYGWESPGVLKETNHNPDVSYDEYCDLCDTQSDIYFQCYMLSLENRNFWRLGLSGLVYDFGLFPIDVYNFYQRIGAAIFPVKCKFIRPIVT